MFFSAMRRIGWQLYPPSKQAHISEFSRVITIMTMKKLLTQLGRRPWFRTPRYADWLRRAGRLTKLPAISASAGSWSNIESKSRIFGLNTKMLLPYALSTYN